MPEIIRVIACCSSNVLGREALEALAAARALGRADAVELLLPRGDETARREGHAHGADLVRTFSPLLPEAAGDDALLEALARLEIPTARLVLVESTPQGRDLAVRLAARLDAAYMPDLVALGDGPEGLEGERPMYAGKILATVRPCGDGPVVATLMPRAVDPAPRQEGREGRHERLAPSPVDDVAKVLVEGIDRVRRDRPAVGEADTVVAGGRGVGGPEGFALLEELADLVGGAVAASRSAVDAGWRPHGEQVGQTGKTIKPELYLACGISGAIQHLVGMRDARVVVAINKSADAPIFAHADYGIVGDLHAVVPALTRALRERS